MSPGLKAVAAQIAEATYTGTERYLTPERRAARPKWADLGESYHESETTEVLRVLEVLVSVMPQLARYFAGDCATATAYPHGKPIPRSEWAPHIEVDLDRGGDRTVGLTEGEATVVAHLLDELAGVYPDGPGLERDPVSCLARRVAVRLWDRMGI